MKVNIEIECTPEEARSFFGLPDVSALQAGLEARLAEGLESIDAEQMLKSWAGAGFKGWETMQERLWAHLDPKREQGGEGRE